MSDLMAVLIGVACGIVASIPTSLLILAIFDWRDRRATYSEPTIIVIEPSLPDHKELSDEKRFDYLELPNTTGPLQLRRQG